MKFKFDNTGLGDSGPVREDHWWERVFNEASSNVNVKKSENGNMKMDLHDKEGVEITNKSFSLKKLKDSNTSLQYGSFLKSATLLANVGTEQEIKGHVSTNDIEIKPIQVLSDEDLFKACNGRTAHKGARHGLNLSGKLRRIAEQEKLLLEKMKGKQNKHEVFREPELKKRKQNPLAELNSSKDDETSDDHKLPVDNESDYVLKSSRKRKKRDRTAEANLIRKIENFGLETDKVAELPIQYNEDETPYNGTPVRKKKKSKHTEKLDVIQETELSSEEHDRRHKRKDKRKRQQDPFRDISTFIREKTKKSKSSNSDANTFELLQLTEKSSDEKLKKRNKKAKRRIDEDDQKMIESKPPKQDMNTKKVKLNSSYDASAGEDEEDIVDKINAEKAARKLYKSKMSKTARKQEKQILKKLAAL